VTVTAINVFVEMDGKQHIAVIAGEMAPMFMAMLGAFQKGQHDGASLIPLHDDVAEHLLNLRRALLERIEAQKKGKP
jgi:hypothetical protein